MAFTVLAVVAGVAAGLVAGGKVGHVGEHHFRAAWLLLAGVVCQGLAGPAGGHLGVPVLLASYVMLLVFGGLNWRLTGMGVVLCGLALNAFVITVDGGMPVRPSSIVSAHAASPAAVARLHLTGKHHLARAGDHLVLLGDAIPVAPLREVLSFGDLILAIGVADVLANLLRPPRRWQRRRARAHSPGMTAPPEGAARNGGRDDFVVAPRSRRRAA